VLKALGIVLLVVLILLGALMPLKYASRLGLPRKDAAPRGGNGGHRPEDAGPRM
jgi:hypothetical protein